MMFRGCYFVYMAVFGIVAVASGATLLVPSGEYPTLQDALAAASNGDEILVAEGVYTPDEGVGQTAGDRAATFQLKNDVAIYGGFPVGSGDWNDRDPEVYETILSGDLNGDDAPNFVNNGDNSYHVVYQTYCDSTAVLDGFIITAGNANGSYPNNRGGGMYNYSKGGHGFTNPTINNCTFIGNYAKYYGGGIYSHYSNAPVTNCKFIANLAGFDGGGVYHNSCALTFINCIFRGNSANRGGGMHNHISNNEVLINCTFSANSANTGGGICNDHWSTNATLTNCILWGNSDSGGKDESAQIHIIGGMLVINYSCIQGWTGGYGGTGNIDDNPLFVDANNGDYHLCKDSLCIDAGDPNYIAGPNETDFDGNPRVVDGDNDGNSVVDMGVYEWMPEPAGLILDLDDDVMVLNLHEGISNSLNAKLNAALRVLEDENENNDIVAINTLEAFINVVEVQRGKKIPEVEADVLIAAAQEIMELLSAE